MIDSFNILSTDRFLLKPLNINDVSKNYCFWLRSKKYSDYIVSSDSSTTKKDLELYITNCRDRKDVLFLGIFVKKNGAHIGNIKYDSIDTVNGSAVMGILIGDDEWNSKGVSKEVILNSALWLKNNLGIKIIALGVSGNNIPAVKAYRKIGFKEADTDIVKDDTSPTKFFMKMVLIT